MCTNNYENLTENGELDMDKNEKTLNNETQPIRLWMKRGPVGSSLAVLMSNIVL